MAATVTKKKGAKKAPVKHAAPARKKAAVPARKKNARVVTKAASVAPAAPKKRTEYFRTYQANRRADAAKALMCIECTTQPRATEKDPETKAEVVISTRCLGCLDRARDSMRAKRALEA